MTEKDGIQTEKVAKEGKVRNKTRSRRDNADLRKKVLKDQTCKYLNFGSPVISELKVKEPLKPTAPENKDEKPKDPLLRKPSVLEKENCAQETDPPRISCEEKTLRIRRKLEKIIHKKEPEEEKGLELLQTLQRMRFTPAVLDSTKICLTIEALKFVVKNTAVVAEADATLAVLKGFQTKEKVEVKTFSEWRDRKEVERRKEQEERTLKEEQEKKRREQEQKRKEHEYRKKKEYERRKREQEIKKQAPKVAQTEERKPKESEEKPAEIKEPEPIPHGAVDSLPSMRIGYWMDRLLDGVDQLSLLDRKVGQIEEKVKTIKPEESRRPEKEKPEKKPSDRLFSTEKPSRNIDDELNKLTSNIRKIEIKEKPKEGLQLSGAVAKSKELPTKPRQQPVNIQAEIEKIKPVIVVGTVGYDRTVVIEYLKALSSLEIDLTILTTTRIGLHLNIFRKESSDPEIVNLSKSIIKKWKNLIPSEEPTEPKPVKTNPAAVEKGPPQGRKTSPEDIRDYCRNKILTALQSNKTLSDSCKVFAEKLAREIEEEIYLLYKDVNSKYRNQVRTQSKIGFLEFHIQRSFCVFFWVTVQNKLFLCSCPFLIYVPTILVLVFSISVPLSLSPITIYPCPCLLYLCLPVLVSVNFVSLSLSPISMSPCPCLLYLCLRVLASYFSVYLSLSLEVGPEYITSMDTLVRISLLGL